MPMGHCTLPNQTRLLSDTVQITPRNNALRPTSITNVRRILKDDSKKETNDSNVKDSRTYVEISLEHKIQNTLAYTNQFGCNDCKASHRTFLLDGIDITRIPSHCEKCNHIKRQKLKVMQERQK